MREGNFEVLFGPRGAYIEGEGSSSPKAWFWFYSNHPIPPQFVTFEGSKLNAIPNRDLAVRAVEKLTQCQLVRNLSSRQGKVQKDYRQMYLNVDIMDLMTIVKTCNLPSAVQKWAQSTLMFT